MLTTSWLKCLVHALDRKTDLKFGIRVPRKPRVPSTAFTDPRILPVFIEKFAGLLN